MTTPDVQVTGLYWTLAGPVEVGTGREWSLFDLRERCEEAARAGFSGIQLWHADLEHVLATGSLREIKQILDDNGLACTDRAHHVKVGNLFGTPCAIGRVADEFALLCADAARQTAAQVVYEFMPFDANANTLDTALVVGADAGNGGLAIDTWHMGKLGIAAADLGRIPRWYLSWIELSDGLAATMPDLSDECLNHRRLPGEGELGADRYVTAGQAAGYTGPWGARSCPRNCGACRCARCTGRPTRRPPPSSGRCPAGCGRSQPP